MAGGQFYLNIDRPTRDAHPCPLKLSRIRQKRRPRFSLHRSLPASLHLLFTIKPTTNDFTLFFKNSKHMILILTIGHIGTSSYRFYLPVNLLRLSWTHASFVKKLKMLSRWRSWVRFRASTNFKAWMAKLSNSQWRRLISHCQWRRQAHTSIQLTSMMPEEAARMQW